MDELGKVIGVRARVRGVGALYSNSRVSPRAAHMWTLQREGEGRTVGPDAPGLTQRLASRFTHYRYESYRTARDIPSHHLIAFSKLMYVGLAVKARILGPLKIK